MNTSTYTMNMGAGQIHELRGDKSPLAECRARVQQTREPKGDKRR